MEAIDQSSIPTDRIRVLNRIKMSLIELFYLRILL